MSIDSALQRVAAINQAAANPALLMSSTIGLTGGTAAPAGTASTSTLSATTTASPATTSASTSTAGASIGGGSFAAVLQNASSGVGLGSLPTLGGAGGQIVSIAAGQVGQAEQPPGSNDSPAIAQYRTATAGAAAGAPWCAYFASWVARQAGEPLGPQGQGLGSVSEIWSWAQSSGRAVANGPGVMPKPGDLIVFGGEHVGIVKDVLPDGRIETIEGNYNNQVSLNTRASGEATGYVSMS